MEEPEEAAAEAEAERGGGLHLGGEAGVVEAELGSWRRAGASKSAASTGNRPQNTTGMRRAEAGRRLGRAALVGDGVADPVSATCLIEAVRKSDSPGPSSSDRRTMLGGRRRPVDRIGALVAIMRIFWRLPASRR